MNSEDVNLNWIVCVGVYVIVNKCECECKDECLWIVVADCQIRCEMVDENKWKCKVNRVTLCPIHFFVFVHSRNVGHNNHVHSHVSMIQTA
jgi:hypothetical protein